MAAPSHTTTEEESEENISLWSEVLEDVIGSSNKSVKATPKNILVLGEVCSGKSTLIDRLCSVSKRGNKRPSSSHNKKYLLSGCSLEYRPIDVYDDETDDYLARLGVWNLDGVVWHSQLLPFVLHERNITDTLVMIVIDLSKPWAALESLERWTEIVHKHVNSLKLSEKKRKQMEENMVKSFQSYIDPEVQGSSGIKEDEDVSLPLEDTVLSYNLGVPVVVVCAKSDCFAQLEKNEKYQDEHFDFLQQHIRKSCLNYGAALAYVSTKDNKNIDILHKYLLHRAYGLKFKVPAYTVERDAVFIPSGWDSVKRIAVLCEQIKHFNPREPLNNVIVPPPKTTVPSQQSENILSEDDQVLLLAQQAHIAKSPRPQTTPTSSAGKDKSPRLQHTQLSTPDQDGSGKPVLPVGGGVGGGGGEVLATFFNNLLSKKAGSTKTSRSATGGGVASDVKKTTPKTDK